MRRILVFVGVIGVALVGVFLYRFAAVTNLTRGLSPVTLTGCRSLGGLTGPEDIAIDYEKGRAFITHADRHGVMVEGDLPMGGIMMLDLTDPASELIPLPSLPEEDFFAHGLDLYIGADGTRRLFVVNHGRANDDHSVEILDVAEEADGTIGLLPVASVRDPQIYSPNDVAAAGPDSFFVTNDIGSRSAFMRSVEPYLMLARGTVVYKAGDGAARVVAEGLRYANGLAIDRSANRLYAAGVLDEAIHVFATGDGGSLDRLYQLDVDMGLDNISIAEDGALWTAGHPKPLAFAAHAANPADVPAPSEVVRIMPGQGSQPRTVFLDPEGRTYSAASSAAAWRDRLLIGAVYEDALLDCFVPADLVSGP